jgi:hypothetical protein
MAVGRNPDAWNARAAERIEVILKDALRQFYFAPVIPNLYPQGHKWTFLRPEAELSMNAPYSTGTVTVASGVVTLASGTFPSWAASGEVTVGGETYSVNTRDSDSQVTLDDTSVDADAGSTYELSEYEYALPDDFREISGTLNYLNKDDRWVSLPKLGPQVIRNRRSQRIYTSTPNCYAVEVQPSTPTASAGQRWVIRFDPAPDAAYTVQYTYDILPDHITTAAPYPYGGAAHGNTIKKACMAQVEYYRTGQHGPAHQAYMEALLQSISIDAKQSIPDNSGPINIRGRQFRYFNNYNSRDLRGNPGTTSLYNGSEIE